jgi:hypothetical protein
LGLPVNNSADVLGAQCPAKRTAALLPKLLAQLLRPLKVLGFVILHPG